MDLTTQQLLKKAVALHASDIFIVAGRPASIRLNGSIIIENTERLMPDDTHLLLEQIYQLADDRDMDTLIRTGDDDFSFSVQNLSRFRVSAFKQRGSLSAVIRVISFELPDRRERHIPERIINLADYSKGLVLVTGPAGNGKSTTLACIIDHINHTQEKHIITLEDPLEYLHRHDKSIVSQREINADTESYVTALRASLRQSPDVILLGEMRDYETTQVAMTAAETGHLIFSTLHTIGAANTIDRIIDVFPPNQQQQVRIQLASVLECIISQQLIRREDGRGRVAALEVLFANTAIRNMIRENKTYQIISTMQTGKRQGMQTMDDAIYDLFLRGDISAESAVSYAQDPVMMNNKVDFKML